MCVRKTATVESSSQEHGLIICPESAEKDVARKKNFLGLEYLSCRLGSIAEGMKAPTAYTSPSLRSLSFANCNFLLVG